jgi:hypothetical protein
MASSSTTHSSQSNLTPFVGEALQNYYDYFYSSADAYIYIKSKEEGMTRNFKDLQFLSIAYSIEQSQKPIYGFWDRTPRAFIPGRSIVVGSFAIPHSYVNRLEEELMNSKGDSYNTKTPLLEKEILKNKYWGTRDWSNIPNDPDRQNMDEDYKKNIFYAAPMFDISIVYGVGEDIDYGDSGTTLNTILTKSSSWGGAQDVNYHLLPESYKEKLQRETITGVKITGKEKSINVGGQPIVETYSWIARQVVPG